MNDSRLSVSACFPAYNEDATIEKVIRDTHGLLLQSRYNFEIIVCDDGSTDKTPDILRRLSAEIPQLRIIRHEHNRGIIVSVNDLISRAGMDVIITNSVDEQWPQDRLLDMVPLMKDADLVVACRTKKKYPVARSVVSFCFNLVPLLFFMTKTTDAGGAMLYRRKTQQGLKIISRSPFAQAERIIRSKRKGYTVCLIPVETRERRTGQERGMTLKLVLSSLIDVIRVWIDIYVFRNARPVVE